jgi:hypothetical protein
MVSTPPSAESAMVVIESGGRLGLCVSIAIRPYVTAALRDYELILDEPSTARFRAKEDLRACLDIVDTLRTRLERTTGPVILSGPQQLICDMVAAATRTATDDLDTRVEKAAGGRPGRAPGMQLKLGPGAYSRLRTEAAAAATLVEAWAACDAMRDSTGAG